MTNLMFMLIFFSDGTSKQYGMEEMSCRDNR